MNKAGGNYGMCLDKAAKEANATVLNICNTLNNYEVSGSAGASGQIVEGDVTVTIQYPTYDKCINTSAAIKSNKEIKCREDRTAAEQKAKELCK